MAVMISMLRALNVGGRNKVKMDALRALYEALVWCNERNGARNTVA